MTLQFTPPVLRMTKPTVTVPPPRQMFFDACGSAMYDLENKVINSVVEERFRDRGMDADLIASISIYLKAFSKTDDHQFFINLANNPEDVDTNNYKIRNLIALTPLADGFGTAGTFYDSSLRNALRIMNGLSVWGFRTDNALVEGYRAVQARALMHVTGMLQYAEGVHTSSHWVSYPYRFSTLFSDPELTDLVIEFPEHHRRISSTVLARESVDVEVIRSILTEEAPAISEGLL